MNLETGTTIKVKGFGGIAFRVIGPAIRTLTQERCDPENGYWYEEEEVVEEGVWDCHMVGDDRKFSIPEEDITVIEEEDFCHGCGQTGCTW